MGSKKTLGLEENLKKLEGVVNQIESGEMGLEESLVKFEEGVSLYKECKRSLGEIEKKIKILSDSLKEEEFE